MKKSKHNFQSTKSKVCSRLSLLFVLFLLATQLGWSQQTIGSYPSMNGGFEGIATGVLAQQASAATTFGQVRTTHNQDTSASGTSIVDLSPRTGSRCVNVSNPTYTTSTRILMTPTTPDASINGSNTALAATYTIQFMYRTPGSTSATTLTAAVFADGTTTTSTNFSANTAPTHTLTGTSGAWAKKVYTVTAFGNQAGGSNGSRFGLAVLRKAGASAFGTIFQIDDLVVYAGAEDTTAPDAATAATIPSATSNSQTVSWTAPGGGVDGGGYMVVRGTTDPTTLPNANGVYNPGITLAAGQQVVYTGTGTSFVDTGLTASTTYFYRIYTVDKAFNYSTSSISVNGTTSSVALAAQPTLQASSVTFANVTGTSFDINWTAGNGANSIVVIKQGAVDSNPTDGSTYTANTIFGSGSQLGSGNFVVYNSTGNTVTVTGLNGLTSYSVNVYTYNGTGGLENYLTSSPAMATQVTDRKTIFSANTAGTNAGASWATTSSWVGGIVPTAADNVVIVTGDKIGVLSGQSCFNATVQTGARLYNNAVMPTSTGIAFLTFSGTSLICDGSFNDKTGPDNSALTNGGLGIQINSNLTISGSGNIKPMRLRPLSNATNVSLTVDTDMEFIFNGSVNSLSGAGLLTEFGTSNDITITVNSGKTLSFGPNSHFCTNADLSLNGKANTVININGTVNLPSTMNLRIADGKTCTLNVNGTLNVGNLNATSVVDGTPPTTVDGVPPVINVGASGVINVSGIADFSSTTLSGVVNGTGTFALASGGTIRIANASGLEPVAGSIRTTTRTFSTGANYSYVGTAAQVTGSDFPMGSNVLTLNNPAGLSLSNSMTEANALTITAGNVLVESGKNLKVINAITNNGSLTVQNNANLIQVNNVANSGSGTTTVNRNSNALFYGDYTMWGSPVTGAQTLANFSPDTNIVKFFTYNSATDKYASVPETSTFSAGNGYLIRMPATGTVDYIAGTENRTFSGVFTGTANNGPVNVSVTSGTYNAVGNPYPSTISATDFITENSLVEPLYFWRKRNANVNGAYATYTTAGGVAGAGDPLMIVPNGQIQVGQGFIAKSTGTSLSFTNAMRTNNTANQILRTTKIERNRVWLNLSKDAAPVNQMMVAYMTGATAGVDAAIDGKPLNDEAVNTGLNSLLNDNEYVIQGRSLPFDASDEVALAFKAETAGNYTIAIGNVDGLFAAGQDVYLADALTGGQTNLKEGAYNFTANAGVDNARFSLKFQKTLKVDQNDFNKSSVKVEKTAAGLVVNSSTVAINKVQVYSLLGRLVASQNNVNALSSNPIKGLKAGQVYIVKVTGANKAVVAIKVLN